MSDFPLATSRIAFDDVGSVNLLEQISGCAGHHRREEGLLVVEGRQDQALHLGVGRSDLSADVDAVPVGQPDVEECNVWSCGRDPVQRVGGASRFAHDFEIWGGADELGKPTTDDLVVIEQEDPNHGAVVCRHQP